MPKRSGSLRPHIYLSLRYSTKEIGKRLVIGASKYTSGPFYRFEEEDQDPDRHKLFTRHILSSRFKFFSNLKCEFYCAQEAEIYFDENGNFRFNNKLLQRVKPGDKDFTLVGQHQACRSNRPAQPELKPPEAQIAINSRGNEVLKQRCIPANLQSPVEPVKPEPKKVKRCFRTNVLDEQQEFLTLHTEINPDQQRAAIQQQRIVRKSREEHNVYMEIDRPEEEEFSIDQIYKLYVQLKKAGLVKFDPIRADPAEWIQQFEMLATKCGLKSSEALFTMMAYFLERNPLEYLRHLRTTGDEGLDYISFREKFILNFASYKSLKIQKAFGYQFVDGDLVDYAKKKFELIEQVFPELSEFDKIRSVIAGMNRKNLIDHFSINMAPTKDQFLIKVTELALGIPH